VAGAYRQLDTLLDGPTPAVRPTHPALLGSYSLGPGLHPAAAATCAEAAGAAAAGVAQFGPNGAMCLLAPGSLPDCCGRQDRLGFDPSVSQHSSALPSDDGPGRAASAGAGR
jgi:hypothetical protein